MMAGMRMLLQLFLFEWRYHIRQRLLPLALAIFFIMGILGTRANFGGPEVLVNAPYSISFYLALLSLFLLVILTINSAGALLRDRQYRFEELVYATPVSKFNYLAARFAGIVIPAFIALGLASSGMLAGLLLAAPERVGPVSLWHYVQPLLVFGVPNTLFSASLLFAGAMLTRNTMAVYITGVLIYVLYMAGSVLGNSPIMANASLTGPQNDLLPVLLDPYGLVGFMGQARFWTPEERNTLLLNPQGPFLLNRVLWCSIALSIVALVYRRFAFRNPAMASGKKTAAGERIIPHPAPAYQTIQPAASPAVALWQAFLSATRIELRTILRSIPFLALMILWIFLITLQLTEHLFHGPFGIANYPSSGQIVTLLLEPLAQLGLFVMLFYAAELAWNERVLRIYELRDSTPYSGSITFLSKLTALAAVIAIFISSAILVGIVVQLTNGYHHFEAAVYLKLYYYGGLPLLPVAVLALALQNLLRNRYVALLISAVFFLCIMRPREWGLEHSLLRYAMMPELSFSDLNGFGSAERPFHWHLLYWGSLAALIGMFTAGTWRHGSEESLPGRLRRFRAGKSGRVFLALAAGLFLFSGAFIFYNSNIVQRYQSSGQRASSRADYERHYKPLTRLEEPVVTDIRTRVDLYPAGRRYRVAGSYHLINPGSLPIDTLLIGLHPEVSAATLQSGRIRLLNHDARLKQYLLLMEPPLPPGSGDSLNFSIEVNRSGFEPFNPENYILDNGSYIELDKMLPFFGYNAALELSNAAHRREHNLPVKDGDPPPQAGEVQEYRWVHFENIISAPNDQQVVAVGELQREWRENGRRFFHYRTSRPIARGYAIAAAAYAVARDTSGAVDIEVYYHPQHAWNVPDMLQQARRSLTLFADTFGPYRHPRYRIAAIPHYIGAATAYPGVVFTTGSFAFLMDRRSGSGPDYLELMMAHETGHQWWPHQLQPADNAGYQVLTETLAQYAELIMLEKQHGKKYTRALLTGELGLYLSNRAYLADEPPLYLAQGSSQRHLFYQKGLLAMAALREQLGEETINRALRTLLERHAWPAKRATTLDLLQALYEQTPVAGHELIDDCFRRVITYDLHLTAAVAIPDPSGGYTINLTINGSRDVQENAIRQAAGLDEDIEIALLAQHPDQTGAMANPIYLQKHRLRQGRNQLVIHCDRLPGYAVIDAWSYRIDPDRFDNIAAVRRQP